MPRNCSGPGVIPRECHGQKAFGASASSGQILDITADRAIARTVDVSEIGAGGQRSGVLFSRQFALTGIAGQPSLTYLDDEETRTFSGDQIKRAHTEFGEVVSVYLKQGREGGGKIFSLIVPRVNVASTGSARVRTHGIVSHQRILVPTPHGQEITNRVISFTGTASLRVF